jgi:hypothetical protein
MKKLLVSLLVAGSVAVAGCNTSGTGGGSATTHASTASTSVTRHSDYGPSDTSHGTTQTTNRTGFPASTERNPLPGDAHRGAEAPGAGDRTGTFTLSGPMNLLPIAIKQGERKEITVKVNRGSNFKEGVALRVENPPKGLTVKPEKAKLAAGENEDTVSIEAAKDAPLGEQTIEITGVPDNGAPTAKPLQIKVKIEKGGSNK